MNSNTHQRCLRLTDLLPEILTKITTHIGSETDIAEFRSTCSDVRSSVQPSPLILFPTLPARLSLACPTFIPDGVSILVVPTSVFLLRHHPRGSAVSWLVAVEQPTFGMLKLVNPFIKVHLDSPRSPLCGYETLEVSKGFALRFEDMVTPVLNGAKVVVWDNRGERYLMMLQYSSRMLECVWTRTGSTVYMRNGMASRFDDIIRRGDAILAVEFTGKLYSIDNLEPGDFGLILLAFNSTRIRTLVEANLSLIDKSSRRKRLLLDSNGDVYLVIRDTVSVSCKFRVFKLNEELRGWEDVVSLGDRVLFVTVNECFFAWASDLAVYGIQGNCIVFPKDCFPDSRGSNSPDETLFQGASENCAIGVYKYGEGHDFTLISSLRGYSDLVRPLPSRISDGKSCYISRDDRSVYIRDTEASSMECLIEEYDDDLNEEVQMAIQDQHAANPNREVGESSRRIIVQDQLPANPNREVGEPSGKINVQDQLTVGLSWNGIGNIRVPEGLPGEPPRVVTDNILTRGLDETLEPIMDGFSRT